MRLLELFFGKKKPSPLLSKTLEEARNLGLNPKYSGLNSDVSCEVNGYHLMAEETPKGSIRISIYDVDKKEFTSLMNFLGKFWKGKVEEDSEDKSYLTIYPGESGILDGWKALASACNACKRHEKS